MPKWSLSSLKTLNVKIFIPFLDKHILQPLKVEDMEDDSASYFWTFAATLSFCSLVLTLSGSGVWNTVGSSITLQTDAKLEFQSASPCEQRPATCLWPLTLPGRAITSCARWQRRGTTFTMMRSVCLCQTPAVPKVEGQWLNWESPWKTQAMI